MTNFVGKWLAVPQSHPMAERFKEDMVAPNPLYESAMRSGRPLPEGVEETDRLWKRSRGHLFVPRAYGERYVSLRQCKDRRIDAPVPFPNSQLELDAPGYVGQEKWVYDILAYLANSTGVIAEAQTGFGKTVCINYVIFSLAQRTLILVHKNFLMRQWRERLIAQGLRDEQIGTIQRGQCEYGGKYVVSIAMIQSLLSTREYPKRMFNSFGLVVCDEVHNMGATTFRQTITMFKPRYRIGISATPDRKDGCQKVFTSHIGPVAVVGKKRKLKPRVKYILIRHSLEPETYRRVLKAWRRNRRDGRMQWQDDLTKIVAYLVNHRTRNSRLVQILVRAVKHNRRLLLLTDRLAHIATLRELTSAALHVEGMRAEIGRLVGGISETQFAVAAGCPLIFGTFAYAKEGLDIPALDVIILATPRSDVVQPIGRILRTVAGKKRPVVIDFVDREIGLCEGMCGNRHKQYWKEKWVPTAKPPIRKRRKR